MKIILLPIAFFQYIILIIRHKLYDWHLLKSKKFDLPVIGVGNLSLGGTGKTPHTEYLIELLRGEHQVAVMSRGYGRKTKGYKLADTSDTAATLGDEPLQYFQKFPEIQVAVDEDRVDGVLHLLEGQGKAIPEVILLDDAFQHRHIEAGLNILLTAYEKLYTEDFLVPAGTLRDLRSAAKRADIIVVSKTPYNLNEEQKTEIIQRLNPLPQQKVFFSTMEYEPLKAVNKAATEFDVKNADSALLFCGIANPKPLIDRIKTQFKQTETICFRDHHTYSENDASNILDKAEKLLGEKKIIVTTEKDYARLTNSPYLCKFESIPLYVVPIHVKFDEKEKFNEEILNHVRKNLQHR